MRPEVQSKGRSGFTGPVGGVWEPGARGLSYRPRRRPGRRGPAPALHPPRGTAPAPAPARGALGRAVSNTRGRAHDSTSVPAGTEEAGAVR